MRSGLLAALAGIALLPAALADHAPTDGTCPHAGYCAPCPDPQAEALADGSIRLAWHPDARVVQWDVTRGTSAENATATVASLPGHVTEWVDEDVEPGVTYHYRLHGLSGDEMGGHCDAIAVTAVPFFGSVAGAALAGVLATAAFVLLRRR